MRRNPLLLTALLTAISTTGAAAQASVSVAGRLATTGPGIEASVRSGHLGIRGGMSFFSWTYKQRLSSVSFETELKFVAKSAILDYYLSSGGSFHLSGGVMTAPIEATGHGRPSLNKVFVIGEHGYNASDVGSLIGVAEWPDAMPYAGLGWSGSTRGDRFKVMFDIGAAFGGPTFSLTATNATAGSPLAADLAIEEAEIQRELDKYAKVYPVVSLGFGVRF
jgi:hypothetical protein